MNPSHQLPGPDVEEEAALWAARLEGSSLGAADRAALDAWLSGDPARRNMLSHFCQFSSDLDRLLPVLVSSGAVAIPHARPRRGPWNPWMVATAGLFAAAVAVAAVWMIRPRLRLDTIATSVAQRREFTLADGTRVELNANTSMVVVNGGPERRVRLADGEAYFVVTKDKGRPFIVETPAGSVRVTGTIFDVRTEAATVLDVTVVEGSVLVRPGEASGAGSPEPVDLEAGHSLSAGGDGVSVRALSPGAIEDALAWRYGQVVFNGVPLSEALACYSRYHGRQITATAAAASAGLVVGGQHGLDDLDAFLADLQRTYPVLRVTPNADGSVRVSLLTEIEGPGTR